MMTRTKRFKEPVRREVKSDRKSAEALLREGVDAMLSGEVETGETILRDDIKATLGFAARSTFRVAPADVVKALLDGGETRFNHRLKFEVGEDIGQVLLDAFADEFADIVGVYALRDAFPDHVDPLGTRARSRHGRERPLEALGEIAS
jgi:hypothetical protein